MRTPEQTRHLEKLMQEINRPSIGPTLGPVGHAAHCVGERTVWLIKESTLELAHRIPFQHDMERWGHRRFWAPWQAVAPNRKAIEREYYGLTREEVRLIQRTDYIPLPASHRHARHIWLQRMTRTLEQIIARHRPTHQVAPQPIHRDPMFTVTAGTNATDTIREALPVF